MGVKVLVMGVMVVMTRTPVVMAMVVIPVAGDMSLAIVASLVTLVASTLDVSVTMTATVTMAMVTATVA